VKQHFKDLHDALNSLQHIRKPGRLGSLFDKLSMSTLKGWFERDVTGHYILRRKYEQAIRAQNVQKAAQEKSALARGIFKDSPQAFQMVLHTLKGMRDSGQPINSTIAQTVITGIVTAVAPELFEKRTKTGFFHVSRRFARKFVRKRLGWTWRRSTAAASKLPIDWEAQGDNMASTELLLLFSLTTFQRSLSLTRTRLPSIFGAAALIRRMM
jgi:hypothetical protein